MTRATATHEFALDGFHPVAPTLVPDPLPAPVMTSPLELAWAFALWLCFLSVSWRLKTLIAPFNELTELILVLYNFDCLGILKVQFNACRQTKAVLIRR